MNLIIKNFLVSFLTIFFGILFGLLGVELFFRKGPFFIIFFFIEPGVIISALISIAIILINFKLKILNKKILKGLLFSLPFLIIMLLGWYTYNPSDTMLFKRFINNELPASLSNIKGTIEYPAIDHIVRISFKINEEDFIKLIKNGDYKYSSDDFPFRVPIVVDYDWWNPEVITVLPQYVSIRKKGIQYLWYDKKRQYGYFMRIRSIGKVSGSGLDMGKSP